ncbi:MAG: response regulator [Synergistetes bacterium]|nr:response regulator [Synergistota bacterium]MDW8191445.1 response regulator [Synergistota bacterium]
MGTAKEKIIVAEDDSKIQMVIKGALEKEGYEILLAKDGLEAIKLLQENPDVVSIVTDIAMPRMTGLELVEEIRKNGPNPDIPILMLSAHHTKENILKATELGINDFLIKPFSIKDLVIRLNRMLGKETPTLPPKREETAPPPEKTSNNNFKKKILVVDDSTIILKIIESTLTNAGFHVITSDNGKQALLKAKTEKPDLILTDIMMPEMDGLTLCEEIRKDPYTQRIPIIIVSAKGQKKDVLEALKRGANGYIVKPFSSKDLILRVKNILGLSQTT